MNLPSFCLVCTRSQRLTLSLIVLSASLSTLAAPPSAPPGDWAQHGHNAAETRYSPLARINDGNVQRLGLAWSYDLESTRAVEATPIVVNGVMVVTASWSVVHALDARTGRKLWTYDPKVPRSAGGKGCCDVVNRGVAVDKGRVYVGSFDGRLIALDARSGRRLWERDTRIDPNRPYTITGAPRVVKGLVLIGNGGAEFGVRGYVTAYDAVTGQQRWRWFTVPGDPAQPAENVAMARAATTWDQAGKYWEAGGGGTVWDSMAYDAELDLLYIGTGNGSPWSRALRSPAGGDNLYLSSIVALRPSTGEYVWHYQTTPGDNWDYTATQQMILADLTIDGRPRKVLMQAPKNGFFFVIDRITGQFISAKNFVDVNWASGFDADGRPIELPGQRAAEKPQNALPGPYGGHNWHSMSFSPKTGLVYLPAQHVPAAMMEDKSWIYGAAKPGVTMSGLGMSTAKLMGASSAKPFGRLIAWDPVAQKEVWRQEHLSPWNGGTLSTAGDLVFQGTADARFAAYQASTGKLLWEFPVGSGVIAAPVSYRIGGKQYVSIAVGWGGIYGLLKRHSDRKGPGTVYTFVLDGKAKAPDLTPYQQGELISGITYDPAQIVAGRDLYVSHCVACHGVPAVDRGGALPNLAYLPSPMIEHLEQLVLAGSATGRGMPDFTGKLSAEELQKIKAFIAGTADAVRKRQQSQQSQQSQQTQQSQPTAGAAP